MPCLDPSLPTDTLPALRPSPWRGLRRGRGVALLAAAGCLSAFLPTLNTVAMAAAPAAAGTAAQAPAETDLMVRARAWLAQAYQVSPAAITVQPLDARLQAGACASAWAFDRPFPQNESVLRARCPDTQWQLFLSVTLPRGATPAQGAVQAGQAPKAAPAGVIAPSAPSGQSGQPAQSAQGAQPAARAVGQAPQPQAPVQAVNYATPLPAPALPAQAQAPAAAIPLVVRRGHTVLTTWSPAPGLEVSARLESLDDGRVGDTIRVRNRDTGRILGALVSGQGQAVGQ